MWVALAGSNNTPGSINAEGGGGLPDLTGVRLVVIYHLGAERIWRGGKCSMKRKKGV